MNKPILLHIPPGHCVPLPGANRIDLDLQPEVLADIKKRGILQNLVVKQVTKGRFIVEAGRRNGHEGWFLIDTTSKNASGCYESRAFFKTEKEAEAGRPEYEIISGV